MKIRFATIEDLEALVYIENECFPPAEACTEQSFSDRLTIYPNNFWLLEIDNKVVAYINGMLTNELTINDEMFEKACLHNDDADWQAIFGVSVLPEYRKQGLAAKVMEQVIADSKTRGKKGLILTCKDKLLNYYAKFGFENYGVSASTHGGEVWYDMRLEF